MKPYEMLAAILRGVGIVTIFNSPPQFLSLQVGPTILAIYEIVIGLILVKYADSIARRFYPKGAQTS